MPRLLECPSSEQIELATGIDYLNTSKQLETPRFCLWKKPNGLENAKTLNQIVNYIERIAEFLFLSPEVCPILHLGVPRVLCFN